jgi:hypothetical protein
MLTIFNNEDAFNNSLGKQNGRIKSVGVETYLGLMDGIKIKTGTAIARCSRLFCR